MNILVTGAWQQAQNHTGDIEKMGHKVIFMQQEKDQLPCEYSWVEGVICNGLFLSHPIEKFANLRYIQLTSAGFDRVPMEYVKEHNIEIHNARGVYSIPMAEFALCGVLQLYKQSRFFMENQKTHTWEKHRGLLELSGKTVCIIGCGSVGSECAKRFKAFGCKMIGVDIMPRTDEPYDSMVGLDKLNYILPEADIVLLTVPLTEDTRYLIDSERIELMKHKAVIVNIARGAVVDSKALCAALASGRLSGAVLDVFEEEPLSNDSPLWEMDNVILTPHNSFVGEGNGERISKLIIQNLTLH